MKRIFGSKRDRLLAKLCVFLIAVALIAGMVGCGDDGGYNPPPSQNLKIWDWYDLNDVRDNLAGNHTLMNDLDSTTPGYEELASPTANGGKGWEPIAFYIPEGGFIGFMGTFDGQGHEIRDLFINRPGEDSLGLFRSIEPPGEYGQHGEAVIRDIGVVNATVSGKDRVGGLVGHNDGTVSNSYFTGNVISGGSCVGGLAGLNRGTVSNSYFTGALTGDRLVGGLVGWNEETVSNSHSSGSVTGNEIVGGLVGWNNDFTSLSNSHSSSSVTGVEIVGGLVGDNGYAGTVSDCYFTGSVIGDAVIGGLVGSIAYGTVSNSYYNYDEVPINGENILTVGALFGADFEEWLDNDKFLDVNERLSYDNGYYMISNVSDFKQLLVFGQNDALKFRLTNDLDLGDEPNFYIPYLAGDFDGNGYKISDLSLNFDFASPLGLFGYLAPSGKVTNVGIENVNITGEDGVGGLVGGTWHGTVSHCYSTGNVAGNNDVGGLVGDSAFGVVSDSYSTATVTGYSVVGGLIGENAGTVTGGTVSNSYSSSNVTGNDAVGGLVGVNEGTVSNSYSTGSVTGDEHIGGLVGVDYGLGTVSNSYSSSNVTGDEYVGGLVGSNGYCGTVNNSYSTGSVTGNEYAGGLVGRNYFDYGEGIVSNCFWDTQTSGQATSDGGTGKTTEQMKNIATFSGAGWNIVAVVNSGTRNLSYIWNIVDDATYPFLSWQS